MPLTPFRPLKNGNADLLAVQKAIQETTDPLTDNQLLDGQLLDAVTLTAGVEQDIPHKLGRKLVGWHVVRRYDDVAPAWQTPTLLNSWVAFGAPYQTPRYRLDPSGVVHVQGAVKDGTVNTGATGNIFVLPAGYRPAASLTFKVHNYDGAAQATGTMLVQSDGAVRAYDGYNGAWEMNVSFAVDAWESDAVRDAQADNPMPDKTLRLVCGVTTTVRLYVF